MIEDYENEKDFSEQGSVSNDNQSNYTFQNLVILIYKTIKIAKL